MPQNDEDHIEVPGEDAENQWHHAFIRPSSPDVDAVLWASVTHDYGIEPTAYVRCYLVDFARGVIFHAYDDRGLDVVALSAAPLLPLYRQFGSWLLDYDRAQMDAVFGALP